MAISMQELSLFDNIGIHNPSLASFQSLSLGMRLGTLTGARGGSCCQLQHVPRVRGCFRTFLGWTTKNVDDSYLMKEQNRSMPTLEQLQC